jgi:hypothetical protein
LEWKDTLAQFNPAGLPTSRQSLPYDGSLLPGWERDNYGVDQERNDWVVGPGGRLVISGSSEQQGGPMVPSPGFEPVDPGQYGNNPFFSGRASLSGAVAAPQGALGTYGARSAAELQALLKMLGQLDLGSLLGSAAPAAGGGLRIAE